MEVPLRERVRILEDELTVLTARVAALESQHLHGVGQMNRIEDTQNKILAEVSAIMPAQTLINELTGKLNAAVDKLEAAQKTT